MDPLMREVTENSNRFGVSAKIDYSDINDPRKGYDVSIKKNIKNFDSEIKLHYLYSITSFELVKKINRFSRFLDFASRLGGMNYDIYIEGELVSKSPSNLGRVIVCHLDGKVSLSHPLERADQWPLLKINREKNLELVETAIQAIGSIKQFQKDRIKSDYGAFREGLEINFHPGDQSIIQKSLHKICSDESKGENLRFCLYLDHHCAGWYGYYGDPSASSSSKELKLPYLHIPLGEVEKSVNGVNAFCSEMGTVFRSPLTFLDVATRIVERSNDDEKTKSKFLQCVCTSPMATLGNLVHLNQVSKPLRFGGNFGSHIWEGNSKFFAFNFLRCGAGSSKNIYLAVKLGRVEPYAYLDQWSDAPVPAKREFDILSKIMATSFKKTRHLLRPETIFLEHSRLKAIAPFYSRHLGQTRELSLFHRLDLMGQCCLGLRELRRLGWYHGDLKSANVLVEEVVGGKYIARVCDFGLARDVSIHVFDRYGTPLYSPPEIVLDGKGQLDSIEIFALGTVALEVLLDPDLFDPVPEYDAFIREMKAMKGTSRTAQLLSRWEIPKEKITPYFQSKLVFFERMTHSYPSVRPTLRACTTFFFTWKNHPENGKVPHNLLALKMST